MLLIFVTGVEHVSHPLACKIVAGFLHYFTLTSFSWMAVEGVNLYRSFVRVFGDKCSPQMFMKRASLLAWGIPALVVLLTSFTAPDYIGPSPISPNSMCIIHGPIFYYGQVLPICLIFLANTFVLIRTIHGINQSNKNKSTAANSKYAMIRVTFACNLLLGSSWIFGLLAVSDAKFVIQLLFCVVNSLQGLFIFIFYCLRNQDVQKAWKNIFMEEAQMKSQSEATRTSAINETYRYSKTSEINIQANLSEKSQQSHGGKKARVVWNMKYSAEQ
jgi:hypothetical protein